MHLFIAFDKLITASEPHHQTVTYSKYAPVCRVRLFLVLHLQISHVFRYQNQVYEFAVATRFFDEGIIYDRAFLCDYCAGI